MSRKAAKSAKNKGTDQKAMFFRLFTEKPFAPPVESRSAELAAGLQVEGFAPWRETVSRKAAKFAKSTETDQRGVLFRLLCRKTLCAPCAFA
jgi:hypothetical protein